MIGALLHEHAARIAPALAAMGARMRRDGHMPEAVALAVAELRAAMLAQAALALLGAMAAQEG